jgi:hypothetical protein
VSEQGRAQSRPRHSDSGDQHAGYPNSERSPDKNAQGGTLALAVDQSSICHAPGVLRLHESELDAGLTVIEREQQQIAPLLRKRGLPTSGYSAVAEPTQ